MLPNASHSGGHTDVTPAGLCDVGCCAGWHGVQSDGWGSDGMGSNRMAWTPQLTGGMDVGTLAAWACANS
eukprot:354789-Chlamydomonas_euryale.AAC.1